MRDDDFLAQFREAPDPVFARQLYQRLADQRAPWWRAGGPLAHLLLGSAATVSALLLSWTLAHVSSAPAAGRTPHPQSPVVRAVESPAQVPATLRSVDQPAWVRTHVVLRVNAGPLAHHHS